MLKRRAPLKTAATAHACAPVFRPRKCKVCAETYKPRTSFQKVCGSIACCHAWADQAGAKAKQAQAKADKKAAKQAMQTDKVRRDALKTRSDWIKDAQRAFNRFIRLRDAGRACICCGTPLHNSGVGGGADAGHYRSIGSAPHLRFDERNVHAQSKQCNRWGSGRAVDYRIGLIDRIGRAAVEALEADQAPRNYSIDDLREIVRTYRVKCKELEKGQQ